MVNVGKGLVVIAGSRMLLLLSVEEMFTTRDQDVL